MAAQVKGMADVQQELTIPLQGLPDLADGVFAACMIPARLPPPSTKWLHSIPPQRDVFGDNKPTWWCTTSTQVGVLSSDGGTCLIDFVHSMRDWCYACLDGGGDPEACAVPAPPCSARASSRHWPSQMVGAPPPLASASGSALMTGCGSSIGQRVSTLSSTQRTSFSGSGQGDDMRTLSILANGTLFLHPDADTPPPHHVRLMPNQASYGEAIEQMGEEIAKMADKGHYSILDVCGRDECSRMTALHPRRTCPAGTRPSWASTSRTARSADA